MELLWSSLIGVLTVKVLFLIFIGTVIGILVGALPGINAPTGIALAIPITFGFSPVEGLILLGTIYGASIYGGSLSAILMNVPGEPSDVVTCFDGYPMAKKGEPQRALELATIACTFGNLAGFLALLFLAPPLSEIALRFGPAEIFWVAIFGMTVIGAISKGNIFNGLLGGCFGMLLSTVGLNSVTGVSRFTFGQPYLVGGIDIVSALIGLFALSEMLNSLQECSSGGECECVLLESKRGAFWGHLIEFFRFPFTYIISSFIGIITGIIPAAGSSIGALLSYGEAKRHSKKRADFGHGAPEGLIAASVGKTSVVGGSIIPLLTLGVPGAPAAAILLGGLIIHGLFPGPELFTTHAHITYTFMLAMVLGSFAILAIGVGGSRIWGQVTRIPAKYLTPTVVALCVIGSCATRNNPSDMLAMAGIGVCMYLASKLGFEPAPVVIGLVLGDLAESGFLLGTILGEAEGSVWSYFFLRPIPLIMISLTAGSLLITAIAQIREKRKLRSTAEGKRSTNFSDGKIIRNYHVNIVVGLGSIIFSFLAEQQLSGLQEDSVVFPTVILWIVRLVGALMVLQEVIWGRQYNRDFAFGSLTVDIFPPILLTLSYFPMVFYTDYYVATAVYLFATAILFEKKKPNFIFKRIAPISAGTAVILYVVFYCLLDVRMPSILFN